MRLIGAGEKQDQLWGKTTGKGLKEKTKRWRGNKKPRGREGALIRPPGFA